MTMLHYYDKNSTNVSLIERLYQVATNKLVRGMVLLNIVMLFVIPILDMILLNMSHRMCFLCLLFMALCAFVFVIVLISGHWNEQQQCMQLTPIINVLMVVLVFSCSWAFYQHAYGGVVWWSAYIFPICLAAITVLLAIFTRIIERQYR